MATETEKLYNESAGTATSPAAAVTTPATPTAPVSTGNASLDNYNTGRVNQINQMYDSQRDAALGQLESAHNRTMSDAQASYDKITPKFQESRNAVGAEYERQRRNNNLQAQANGLNTGANSQMQLAASSVYQQNQAGLQKAENEALNEANRQMTTMKEQYEADVADALAKNDAQRAAALLNEYGQQYDRMQNEAKQLAAYGDFSLYAQLYGQEAANGMQRAWDLQNPQLAYTLGRLTADEYFRMTGKYPPGSPEAAAQAASSGGGGGYGYGGGGNPPDGKVNLSTADLYTLEATGASEKEISNFINQYASNPAEAQSAYKGVLQGQLAAGEAMWNRGSSGSSQTSGTTRKTTAPATPTTPTNTEQPPKYWGEGT